MFETDYKFTELELKVAGCTVALLNGTAHLEQDGEACVIDRVTLDSYNKGEESLKLHNYYGVPPLEYQLLAQIREILYRSDDLQYWWASQLRDYRDESRYGYAEVV